MFILADQYTTGASSGPTEDEAVEIELSTAAVYQNDLCLTTDLPPNLNLEKTPAALAGGGKLLSAF